MELPGRCRRGRRGASIVPNEFTKLTPVQSEADDESDTESEFEAESAEMESSESSQDESDYDDGSDASDDEGSGSDFGSDESEGLFAASPPHAPPLTDTAVQVTTGMSWNARRRKVRRSHLASSTVRPTHNTSADKKRAEVGAGHDSDDSERPKKSAKSIPKPKAKVNGKR